MPHAGQRDPSLQAWLNFKVLPKKAKCRSKEVASVPKMDEQPIHICVEDRDNKRWSIS